MLCTHPPLRFLLAGEALFYLAAAIAWLTAWRRPSAEGVARAAFVTASGFFLKFIRISVAIMAMPS